MQHKPEHRGHSLAFLDADTVHEVRATSQLQADLEVGQSSSGPMSMALEMQCDVIAARTRTFMELARYQPDTFEFFEVGNFVELGRRIQSRVVSRHTPAPLQCTTQTSLNIYIQAFGDCEPGSKR